MASTPQPLAFELLHRQHADIDALLGRLMAREGDTDSARSTLCECLEHHMVLEEKIFYPALARLEMLASFVDHLRDQHSVIRQYLQELRETPAQHDAFPQVVHRLDEAFDLHVDEEESRAFAYATEHLAGELDALAVEMEHQQDSLRGAYGVG